MHYTSEIYSRMLTRDAQQRNTQESALQTYEVVGTPSGGVPYRDGTIPRDWSVLFQYPDMVKRVVQVKGVLVWQKYH